MAEERALLSDNALRVLQACYLRCDPGGQVAETPEGMFRRVAHSVAQAGANFGDADTAGRWEETFFDALVRLDLLPNSPPGAPAPRWRKT